MIGLEGRGEEVQAVLLDGKWWLRPVTEFVERWRRPELVERSGDGWLAQELPAHWQELPKLAEHEGNVVYRRRFTLPAAGQRRRWWLRLGGVFYYHRAWIDGKLVGSGEGYFFPHEYDITEVLREHGRRREHVLVVEVSCPEERDKQGKKLITGVFSHWDAIPPANPGGIWLPVELFSTSELRLKTCLLETVSLAAPAAGSTGGAGSNAGAGGGALARGEAAANARLRLRVALAAFGEPRAIVGGDALTLPLTLEMRPLDFAGLAFRRDFSVAVPGAASAPGVDAPAIASPASMPPGWTEWWHEEVFDFLGAGVWWPHDLGKPRLYQVTVILNPSLAANASQPAKKPELDSPPPASGIEGGELRFRFGVRTVARGKDAFYINGVRHHLKGNNYPPADMRLARVTPELVRTDLELAKEAYHNILRVHAHVDHPALYDATDEAGVLLWQDFPLQWLYHPDVFREAERQAGRMIERLFNHPSIIMWCLHNEPVFVVDTKDETTFTRLRSLASTFLYSRNREVLDRRLARLARRLDPGRPRLANSGDLSLLSGGWDSHFYFGWYVIYGQKRTFDRVTRFARRYLRLVSEFGAQSFPNLGNARRLAPDTLHEEDWRRLEAKYCAQPAIMRRWLSLGPVAEGGRLADLVRLTQGYQSEINRYYIDRLRVLKFRPNAGILPFMFQDAAPAVTWSVIDYWRQTKSSYYALRDAFRPQYVLALLDRDVYRAGRTVSIPVWVVNDGPEPVARGWSVRAVVRGRGPVETSIFADTWDMDHVDAEGPAVRAGVARFVPQAAGLYELDLRLTLPDGRSVDNRYSIEVLN